MFYVKPEQDWNHNSEDKWTHIYHPMIFLLTVICLRQEMEITFYYQTINAPSSSFIHNLLLSNWIVFNCYLIYTFVIFTGRCGLNTDFNRTDKSLCLLVNGSLYQFVTITFNTVSLNLLIVYSAWWFLLITYRQYGRYYEFIYWNLLG